MFDEKISILIPYKLDGGHRDKNWNWIKRRYELLMPNAEICIGNYDKKPFSRAAAINNAAKLSTRDIFIIADADIIFDMNQIALAILNLCYNTWIIPYTVMNYLTLEQTNTLHNMNPNVNIRNINFTGYSSVECTVIYGGINVLPRKCFEKVGGFDERFEGWGAEDDAFQRSIDALCGSHIRIPTALWHMYHPIASKNTYKKNCELLYNFYKDSSSIIRNFNEKKGI